jgi:hypothetical protein
MIMLLLLLAALDHPRAATVLEVRSNAEFYLDQRIRVCGHLATTNGKPYLWEVGLYHMRVGILLRGKWKERKGRTCIIGRMMRADGKRPGDPQYYSSSLPDDVIHPSYYLQAER